MVEIIVDSSLLGLAVYSCYYVYHHYTNLIKKTSDIASSVRCNTRILNDYLNKIPNDKHTP